MMPDTEAMAERARIVAWLRALEDDDWTPIVLAEKIESGDHDYIAIPRLSGDQVGTCGKCGATFTVPTSGAFQCPCGGARVTVTRGDQGAK